LDCVLRDGLMCGAFVGVFGKAKRHNHWIDRHDGGDTYGCLQLMLFMRTAIW
jgi:hypothetical protein